MAKHTVIFLQDHTVEVPAAVLETRLEKDGAPVHSIPVPAHTFHYKQGQKITCHNKKDLAAMLRAYGDKVRVEP